MGCGQSRDPASLPYRNRSRHRRGMVTPRVISAFRSIGWGWGGAWAGSTKDCVLHRAFPPIAVPPPSLKTRHRPSSVSQRPLAYTRGRNSPIGSVAEIWQRPRSSRWAGNASLGRRSRGAACTPNRMWAVRDVKGSDTFTTARRWPVLLQCSARFVEDPAGRSAGGRARGDGALSTSSSSDPAIHDRLSQLIGKPAPARVAPGALREAGRYRTPQATKADMRRQFAIPDGEPLRTSQCSRCASSPSWPGMPLRSGRRRPIRSFC